jgi:hypothetical protein
MKLRMKVDGQPTCLIEVWEDRVPHLSAVLRQTLPQKSILQHGKIVGDMVFFTMPIVAPWENCYLTEEVGRMRRAEKGHVSGAVCFYNPRQQFCVVYGDDVADENLKISYIGEVVEGQLELALAGTRTWLDQGKLVELELA